MTEIPKASWGEPPRNGGVLGKLPRYDDPQSDEYFDEDEAEFFGELPPACFRCGSRNVDVKQDGCLTTTRCQDCRAVKQRVE